MLFVANGSIYPAKVSGMDRDGKTRGWYLGKKGKGRLHELTDRTFPGGDNGSEGHLKTGRET